MNHIYLLLLIGVEIQYLPLLVDRILNVANYLIRIRNYTGKKLQPQNKELVMKNTDTKIRVTASQSYILNKSGS